MLLYHSQLDLNQKFNCTKPLIICLVCLGCNIVDIGANDGDSALILAVAAKGGTVAAFEMGTAIDMLRINKKYEPFPVSARL